MAHRLLLIPMKVGRMKKLIYVARLSLYKLEKLQKAGYVVVIVGK